MSALAAAGGALLSLVLPPRCPGCGDIVAVPDAFCPGCFAQLAFVRPPLCARCGEPFPADPGPEATCHHCRREPPAFASARAAFAYAGPAKAVVLALKHGDATHHVRLMAGAMARTGAGWLGSDAVLVPVPLHRRRLWRRGFNQAALLARALGRRAATPVAVDALVRTRATPPSGGLTRPERHANVAGAFAAARPAAVAGRRVLLVDDVLTSGATGSACAQALLAAGAAEVNLLTFARVVLGGVHAH